MANIADFKYRFEKSPFVLENYKQKSVEFGTPRLVDYFEDNYDSITPAKRVPYFKELKKYPLDLNYGYEKYKFRKSSMYKKYVDITLKHVMSPKFDDVDNVEHSMVYTRRGTLTHIMESNYINYNKFGDLKVRVSRYDGKMFMVQEEEDESEPRKPKKNTNHCHLHRYLFAGSPKEEPKAEPYDENIRLVAVHRATLGKYDIVYSGEVQGIITDEKFEDFDDIDAFNECRFVLTKQMWKTLKYKEERILNYWLQAYLANVNDLYMAYKDREGIIREPIEHKIVSDLPKNRNWKPKVCIEFLHYFLEGVGKIMSNVNCLNTVYVFHFDLAYNKISHKIYEGKTEKHLFRRNIWTI